MLSSLGPLLSSAQQNLENLKINMQDSVSLEDFDNPMVLTGCGHSFSLSTIQTLLANVKHGKGSCPTCRSPIIGYVPNHSLRQVQEVATPVLPLVAKQIAEGALPDLPFPGEPTAFMRGRAWNTYHDDENISLIRKISIMPRRLPSLLGHVNIYGDSQDNVSIVINFVDIKKETFKNYFSRLGLINVDYADYSCTATQPRELDWALRFLTENNTFDPKCNLPLITELLRKKHWRHVEQEMNVVPKSVHSEDLPPPYEDKVPPALEGKGSTTKELVEKSRVSPTTGYDQKAVPALPQIVDRQSYLPTPRAAATHPTAIQSTTVTSSPASTRSVSPRPSTGAVRSAGALAKEFEAKFRASPTAGYDEKASPPVEGKGLGRRFLEQKRTVTPPRNDHDQVYG